MHKHLQNLQRLCQKLQFRYGDDDDLVIQLKHELESLEARKSRNLAMANLGRRKQDMGESSMPLH